MHQTFFKHDLKSRVDLALERERAEEAAWRACCKVVDARDRRECRCCGRRSNPDAVGLTTRGHRHHIVYRSAGGPDTSENVVTLCFECHNAEHKQQLQIDGNADDAVTFWKKDAEGIWFIWRREVSVGRFDKD